MWGWKDFETLYDFVKENEFDRLWVFTYSRRRTLYNQSLKLKVVIKNKKAEIMQLQKEIVLKRIKID